MTISTLDAKTALLVVDLQKGIVGLPTAHPMADVMANAVKLLGAFRRRGLPVVLINVAGGAPGRSEQSRARGEMPAGWTDLVPELDRQSSDHVVTKRTWGAFTNTDLEQRLRQAGVTQVVIAGVATGVGVESTARHAYELGFNVALAVDAMTDLSLEAHDHSIQRIFPCLGETGTTEQIAALVSAA
ncbi:cysteine hydrolase [Bradyrhizobium sp. AZCC 2289]|uniref:cysteine hydrolase n=1 Tax=Bradyrhizobium sp. AZCC 2289 TaxID=3117026 RepID=UPI002FF1F582